MRKRWTAAILAALVTVSTATTTVKADDTNTATVNTNESQTTATDNQTNSASTDKVTYNKADYLSANPKLVKVKHATTLYRDAALTKTAHNAKAGSHFLISKIIKSDDQVPVLKTNDGFYLPAKKSLLTKVKAYQNPKQYH